MIPSIYEEWKYCIEIQCKIPLTKDFILERLRVLSDASNPETRVFGKAYGSDHLNKIIQYFKKSLTQI